MKFGKTLSMRPLLTLAAISAFTLSATLPNSATADGMLLTQAYSVKMTSPYRPHGTNGGFDDYRCFLLNPHVIQNSVLTSIQFIPQNPIIVHHAIMFRIPANQVAGAAALDSQGQGWPCFGGSGIGSMFQSFITTPWLSAWVPGRTVDTAPKGYGYPFNKGDEIVLQVHYNLLMAAGMNSSLTDQSKVVFNAVPATGQKINTLGYQLFPAPVELACPAGVTGQLCDRKAALADLAARTSTQSALEVTGISVLCHQNPFTPQPSDTSTCDQKITHPSYVIAAAPHMHLLGRALKITVNPGSANEQILLNNTNYNFDDQAATVLPKPVQLKIGDTVRVQCTFDPTLRQKLPLLRKLPAKYVTWGEGSGDEMCLGVLITSQQVNS
jgi:Tfp pilus assembly protein PilV